MSDESDCEYESFTDDYQEPCSDAPTPGSYPWDSDIYFSNQSESEHGTSNQSGSEADFSNQSETENEDRGDSSNSDSESNQSTSDSEGDVSQMSNSDESASGNDQSDDSDSLVDQMSFDGSVASIEESSDSNSDGQAPVVDISDSSFENIPWGGPTDNRGNNSSDGLSEYVYVPPSDAVADVSGSISNSETGSWTLRGTEGRFPLDWLGFGRRGDGDQQRQTDETGFRERSWSLEECSICCEVMLKDHKLLMLPCGHKFHDGCVQPWLEEHETCPNCRKTA